MAKRQRESDRGNRTRLQRGEPPSCNPEGSSGREASHTKESVESKTELAGNYFCAILTVEELRQTIGEFATCLEHLDCFPAKCAIREHATDGTYSLSIEVTLPPLKPSASNSV